MDTKREFTDAVNTGREIEFSFCGQHYFASRRSDADWYIYHEETAHEQHFSSALALLNDAILQGRNIGEAWMQITIDCIL